MSQQRIVPNIWYAGTAEAAGAWYASVFEDARYQVEARYPTENLPEFQQALAGQAVSVALTIADTRFTLINAGDEFRPNPSISFMLNFDPLRAGGSEDLARAEMERLWTHLSDDGKMLMPLSEYPFSQYYGWVEDRYGVSWQLMLTDPEGDPRPFIIPALLFDGAAQDRAAEAADTYVKLFADTAGGSEIGHRSPYGTPTGKASADALAFGDFRIGNQWFMAADNGSGVDHGFNCGVSLEVQCADQAEIDRLWSALSTVPEAEACGWLADQFGVSWQIVPANMGALMNRQNAWEHLMGMKRIIIDEL